MWPELLKNVRRANCNFRFWLCISPTVTIWWLFPYASKHVFKPHLHGSSICKWDRVVVMLHKYSYWISRNRLRILHGMSITLKACAGGSNTGEKIWSYGVERVLQPHVFCEGSSLLKWRDEAEVFFTLLFQIPDYFPKTSSGWRFSFKAWTISRVFTHRQTL